MAMIEAVTTPKPSVCTKRCIWALLLSSLESQHQIRAHPEANLWFKTVPKSRLVVLASDHTGFSRRCTTSAQCLDLLFGDDPHDFDLVVGQDLLSCLIAKGVAVTVEQHRTGRSDVLDLLALCKKRLALGIGIDDRLARAL